jgi:hypothetical protein
MIDAAVWRTSEAGKGVAEYEQVVEAEMDQGFQTMWKGEGRCMRYWQTTH